VVVPALGLSTFWWILIAFAPFALFGSIILRRRYGSHAEDEDEDDDEDEVDSGFLAALLSWFL
jgi:hypothetical protein